MHMIQYLIIGIQRSGTTAIHKALMKHPHVSVLTDELRFSPLFDLGVRAFTFGNETDEERAASKQKIFQAITTLVEKSNVTHCGAKTCCTILPSVARGIIQILRNDFPEMKIILVERKDIVAQYGSSVRARKSGIYHSWDKGADSAQPGELYLNPLRFIFYALDCLEINRKLSYLVETHDSYKVVYEQFCDDPAEELRKICKFLGLSDTQIAENSKKLMPSPDKYVSNYGTLKKIETWICQKDFTGTTPKSLQLLSHMNHWLKSLKLALQLIYLILRTKPYGVKTLM